ncbi:hypothetical protein CSA56_07955 [candidate division KSB3 bacterium]|uniref:Uncharacterized protein n=1 Tax=candidate division KSB3 bacterium TaxID=2044937 RepID=A0A2G6KHM3_9BACT|nr:MAG: hypothetical protein CSA56_07955 [candidate division KSB3 bacterium]
MNQVPSAFSSRLIVPEKRATQALSEICDQGQEEDFQGTYQNVEQAMVHESWDDVMYEAISWSLDNEKAEYIDVSVGKAYAPYKYIYVLYICSS